MVYNTSTNNVNFCYNYWNSSDTRLIAKKISGSESQNVIIQNFRTTEIDTSLGADTIAPEIPSIYNVDTSVLGQITVKWTKPVNDENGAGLTGLSGYRLYRANGLECRTNGDTDNWEHFLIFTTNLTNDTDFVDTDVIGGETYYYRIVAYDSHQSSDGSHQFYNRSWYSASYQVNTKNFANYICPDYADTEYIVNINNIIGNETAYIININKVDTFIVNVTNYAGFDTWSITLISIDTGSYISLKSIPESVMNTTDTSNIKRYNYGIGASLQADVYDSGFNPFLFSQYSDSPVLKINFANRGISTDPSLLRFYYLNTADSKWYEAADADSGAAQGSNYELGITNYELSLRVQHLSHWWLGSLTDTITVTAGEPVTSDFTTAGNTFAVISVFVMGDTAFYGDTLSLFSVKNLGNLDSSTVLHISLFEDNGSIGIMDSGIDTYVGELFWNTNQWKNDSLNYAFSKNDTGTFFLVTVMTADTAQSGDSFQAAININGIKSVEENTGPAVQISNSGIITIINTFEDNNWYVDITNGDTSYNGLSRNAPKKYIGNITNNLSLLTYGDTINVAAGTYVETIVIDCSGVTLISDSGPDYTFLEQGTVLQSSLIINQQDVGVIGFTFINGDQKIIEINNVAAYITKNKFINNPVSYVINVTAGSLVTNTRIFNNYFQNCDGTAIYLSGAITGCLISNNTIIGCNGSAIQTFGGAYDNTISNNLVIGATGSAYYATNIDTFIFNNAYKCNAASLSMGREVIELADEKKLPLTIYDTGYRELSNETGIALDIDYNYDGISDSGDSIFIIGYYGDSNPLIQHLTNNPPSAINLFVQGETASGIFITDTTTEFSWTFSDADNTDSQTDFQIEIATDFSFSNIVCSSAMIKYDTDLIDNYTLTETQGLSNGLYYFRIRVNDGKFDGSSFDGQKFFGPWSSGTDSFYIFPYEGPFWYVSADTGLDSNNGSETFPFKTITKALRSVSSGDTVFVYNGIYSETVVIDTDNISLIGSDSSLTIIDPPGDSLILSLYGVYCDTQVNLKICNLKVRNCFIGYYFINIDSSVFENLSAEYCGGSSGGSGYYFINDCDSNVIQFCQGFMNYYGFVFNSKCNNNTIQYNLNEISTNSGFLISDASDTNIFKNNTVYYSNDGILISNSVNNLVSENLFSNNTYGIEIVSAGYNNIFSNIVKNSLANGISIFTSSGISIKNNVSSYNSGAGYYCSGSINNIFINNLSSNNKTSYGYGFSVYNSEDNYFYQNTSDSNESYGFYITGSSSNDTFEKNNVKTSYLNPDSYVYISGDTVFDFRYNYWTTTDSAFIDIRIIGNGVLWSPFRTSEIDTAIGADTIAPNTTTIISADTYFDGRIKIVWDTVTLNEAGGILEAGDSGIAGFRIFRASSNQASNGDTSNWYAILYDTVAKTETSYIDLNVNSGETYYYRISAFDSHITAGQKFYNQAWYSNIYSVVAVSIDTMQSNNWYIDIANGDTNYDGLTENTPKKYLSQIFGDVYGSQSLLTQGDTVYIDTGVYAETITINTDAISVIGVDSNAVIIDPPGDSCIITLYGISAIGRKLLVVKSLRITECYNGILFDNVDSSVIEDVTVDFCGKTEGSGAGIYLYNGSDSNAIRSCYAYNNFYGFYLYMNINNNMLANNASIASINSGFSLYSNCINNVLENNISLNTNNAYGFEMYWNCNSNIFTDNFAANNFIGFTLSACSLNKLTNNSSSNNSGYGFHLFNNSDNNILLNNLSSNNKSTSGHGFYIDGSSNNYFNQNNADSNYMYGIYITGESLADTFIKNNWIGSLTNPDSAVYISGDTVFDFKDNYWATTDSALIDARIIGDGVLFAPFRFSEIDAAIWADTIAPETMTINSSDTSILGKTTIYFNTPTVDENGTALDYDNDAHIYGFHIFRADSADVVNGDTSNWYAFLYDTILVSSLNKPNYYTDNNVIFGETYYYRITAFDSHQSSAVSYQNEAWYSNIMRVWNIGGIDTTLPNAWYVDIANGDTSYSGLSEGQPKKYLGQIFGDVYGSESLLTQGDTVYIDTGTYAETVTINTDAISVIGADSIFTIITSPVDSTTTQIYGIYADSQNFLNVRNLSIMTFDTGIHFYNCDTATISYITSTVNNEGINLTRCDSVNILYCDLKNNISNGLMLLTSTYNTVLNSVMKNSENGALIMNNSNYNYFANNSFLNNTTNGAYIYTSNNNAFDSNYSYNLKSSFISGFKTYYYSSKNIFRYNTIENNYYGIYHYYYSTENIVLENKFINNSRGLYIWNNADYNTSAFNLFSNSGEYGFHINDGDSNLLYQNQFDSSGIAHIYVQTSGYGNIITKNNFTASIYSADSFIINSVAQNIDLRYNYWNTSDSVSIRNKIKGTAQTNVLLLPFRTTQIDTTTGADTVAPNMTTIISADTYFDGRIKIKWDTVTLNEAGGVLESGDLGITSFWIFRASSGQLSNGDTSNWFTLLYDTIAKT
ncbi:MAG TPA: right-handed parallel beta-helix repeat-containing protein [bacterium]|nr:right-handed parallel beta-helix repeat-containing protein [bacterium]